MDETNLLSLIRPWLDNICQITTKNATVPFYQKFCMQTGPESTSSFDWRMSEREIDGQNGRERLSERFSSTEGADIWVFQG
jgi:cytochrome c oxidase assembly protein Cox11